jgi:hypothetical protein
MQVAISKRVLDFIVPLRLTERRVCVVRSEAVDARDDLGDVVEQISGGREGGGES